MEIILRWQIHPFSCLIYFRALMTSKRAEKLRGLLFLEGGRLWSEGEEETESARQKGVGPRGHPTWSRGTPYFGLRGSAGLGLLREASFWPKTAPIKSPRRSSLRGSRHERNQKTEAGGSRLEGEKLRRSPAGGISLSSIDISTISMMKGE